MVNVMNIWDALELHKEISPYMDKPDKDVSVLTFARGIIDRMQINPMAYLRCVEIISKKPREEILQMKPMDIFEIFLTGLLDNHVFDLMNFGRQVGLKYG